MLAFALRLQYTDSRLSSSRRNQRNARFFADVKSLGENLDEPQLNRHVRICSVLEYQGTLLNDYKFELDCFTYLNPLHSHAFHFDSQRLARLGRVRCNRDGFNLNRISG